MRRPDLWMGAVLVVAAAALVAGDEPADTKEAQPISDEELSIYPGSVFDVPVPAPVAENDSFPGDRPLPPRRLAGFPPVVPHAIADFLPITRRDNACIDCHAIDEKEEGDPTPIPASHYVAPEDGGQAGERVLAGRRYLCVSCHVPQTDAAPLVQNRLEESSDDPESRSEE